MTFEGVAGAFEVRTSPWYAIRLIIADATQIDHLQQFLHVYQYGEYLGFDLIGWILSDDGSTGRPMALEVKSSSEGGFLISAAGWRRAQSLRDQAGMPARYAVLVGRRIGSSVPKTIGRLEDPYNFVAIYRIARATDTFHVTYVADRSRP